MNLSKKNLCLSVSSIVLPSSTTALDQATFYYKGIYECIKKVVNNFADDFDLKGDTICLRSDQITFYITHQSAEGRMDCVKFAVQKNFRESHWGFTVQA